MTRERERERGHGWRAPTPFASYFLPLYADVCGYDIPMTRAYDAGLDPVEAAEYLESGAGATEIAEAQSILARLGIHSIPTFIINGRRAVGGAARSGELTRVLRHVEAQEDDGDGDSIAIPRSLFADALGVPTELLHEPLPESSILTST